MHRVELKVEEKHLLKLYDNVPNAPCGVESCMTQEIYTSEFSVPNAPCGVERILRLMSVC